MDFCGGRSMETRDARRETRAEEMSLGASLRAGSSSLGSLLASLCSRLFARVSLLASRVSLLAGFLPVGRCGVWGAMSGERADGDVGGSGVDFGVVCGVAVVQGVRCRSPDGRGFASSEAGSRKVRTPSGSAPRESEGRVFARKPGRKVQQKINRPSSPPGDEG